MAKYKAGAKYGKVTILEVYPYIKGDGGTRRGLVCCECSPEKHYVMNVYNLGTGHTKSCGCLQEENAGRYQTTHGKTGTKIYNTYIGILSRCNKESSTSYPNYGGRGIKVCDRWLESFEAFYEDMGEPPTKLHSIDRIDVNGDYSPESCRWATAKEQSNNKRNHHKMTLDGRTQNMSQWAEELDIDPSGILSRLARGWSEEETLKTPSLDENKYYKYKDEVISHQKLAVKYGIHEATLRDRLKKGWSLDDALNTPTNFHHKTLTLNGETKTIAEWSDATSLPWKLIHSRIAEGWSVEQILTTPKNTPRKIKSAEGTEHTLSEWAELMGKGYKFVWKRLKNGDSIDTLISELL
jgi:hypothetical protein